jgi:hypothetical protein
MDEGLAVGVLHLADGLQLAGDGPIQLAGGGQRRIAKAEEIIAVEQVGQGNHLVAAGVIRQLRGHALAQLASGGFGQGGG